MAGCSSFHSPVVSHATLGTTRGRAASAPAASFSGWDRWNSTSTRYFSSRSTSRPCSACCCCSPGSRTPGIHAVAWWGCAHLLRAGSVALFGMYGSVSDVDLDRSRQRAAVHRLRRDLVGARVFDGRAPEPLYLVGGAVLWILVCRTPVLRRLAGRQGAARSGIITAYTWATAYEFWRGRSEPLVSRWPAIFMLFAHGALFLLRTPLVARCCRGRRPTRCSTACG